MADRRGYQFLPIQERDHTAPSPASRNSARELVRLEFVASLDVAAARAALERTGRFPALVGAKRVARGGAA